MPPRLSRLLFDYVGRLFFTRFLALLLGIAFIMLALDMLSRSDEIMKGQGATLSSLWKYLFLRLPQLLSELPPFTVLLASLLTLGSLNQHSEVTVMKSSGLSAYHIVAPIILVSAFIGIFHFLFNEIVTVPANGELRRWTDNNFAITASTNQDRTGSVWVKDGADFVRAADVNRLAGGRLVLSRLMLYRLDDHGIVTGSTSANFALYDQSRWTLYDVKSFDILKNQVTTEATLPWDTHIPPERFLALSIRPDEASFVRLIQHIVELKNEGQPTTWLMTGLLRKISSPFASVIMPLLGAIAGFGVFRSGHLLLRSIIGMALGFAYFVGENLAAALGQFGTLPPFLAAWSPVIVFAAIGLYVVTAVED